MDWEEQLAALFDDLEQQAEAVYDTAREIDLADRSRAEYAAVSLASRLMASLDAEVTLGLRGVGRVTGRVARVGDGWLWLQAPSHQWIVRSAAIGAVRGASPRSVPEVAWSPVTRLGLGSPLRRLADSGEACVVHLLDAERFEGVLWRVGSDFAELRAPTGQLFLAPFAALAAIRSAG